MRLGRLLKWVFITVICLMVFQFPLNVKAKDNSDIGVGDVVNFGRIYWVPCLDEEINEQLEGQERGYYEVDGIEYYSNGGTSAMSIFSTIPLRWIVVGEDDESYVLLQEIVTDTFSFDREANYSYKNSSLRELINAERFISERFNDLEQADILVTSITTSEGTMNDLIIIPSKNELSSFFDSQEARVAHYYNATSETPYSFYRRYVFNNYYDGIYDEKDYVCAYWTRDKDDIRIGERGSMTLMGYVDCDGNFDSGHSQTMMGIRPMIRVKKNSDAILKAEKELPESIFLLKPTDNSTAIPMQWSAGGISFRLNSNQIAYCKEKGFPFYQGYSQDNGKVYREEPDEQIKAEVGMFEGWVCIAGLKYYEEKTTYCKYLIYPKKPEVSVSATFSKKHPKSNRVTISWERDYYDGYIGTDYVEVSRSKTADGEYEVIFSGKETEYIDTDVEDGTLYWYKVRGLFTTVDEDGNTICTPVLDGVETEFSEPVQVKDPIYLDGSDTDDTHNKEEVKTITMLRLYNPNSGEHFYTSSEREKKSLEKAGWNYEGVAWEGPSWSNTPVYRLYNENVGEHHYTPSKKERDKLIKLGWKDEGIGWYSDDNEGTPLYRLYNPNATTGNHHYTTSTRERDKLVKIGWNDEGIGWYGY